jgi:hypothetical protein
MSLPPRGQPPPHLPSIHPGPTFPNYAVPQQGVMDRSQAKPLFKMANKMVKMKMPKNKVLHRRTRVAKKKFKIV